MENNQKWYQSKKFAVAIAGVLVPTINHYLGMNLSEDQIAVIIMVVLGYIGMEGALDFKNMKAKDIIKPLNDPIIREAIETLILEAFDFAAAKDKGLSTHAAEVVNRVMGSLESLLGPDLFKQVQENTQLRSEILRRIFKMYNDGRSMLEGADIVKKQISA